MNTIEAIFERDLLSVLHGQAIRRSSAILCIVANKANEATERSRPGMGTLS
jgi:hypothetical protein